MPPAPDPVLLFDGECGLCNRVVRTLMRWDGRARLRYAALQGPAGQAYLRRHRLGADEFSTVVFVPDWGRQDRPQARIRSDAVVAALRVCGGGAAVLGGLLGLVPRFLRDAGYKGVARLRFRLFGPWRACDLPRPEWRRRILD